MTRIFLGVAVAAVLLVPGLAMAQAAAPAETVKVGILTDGASEAWTAFRDAAMPEAAAVAVALDFRILSPATAEQQQKTAAEMLAAGIKALAVCPVDPAQQQAFLTELSGKIPLVLLNRDAAGTGRACFIGLDEKEAGKKMAELVTNLVPPGMKLAALLKTGESESEKARMAGLKEGLAPGEYVLDAVKADKGDRNLAWANADELMGKHVELAAYIAFEAYELPALLRAATARKMDGMVNLIGFLDSPDMREAFSKGKVQGAVRVDTAAQAKQTVAVLRGLAVKDPAFKLPESGVIGIAPTIETTPNPMSAEEKMDALQIPRILEEAPAPARPSFE